MDIERLLKRYRKKPLAKISGEEGLQSSPSFASLDYGVEEIKRIIPHREPFLLVDRLTAVDLEVEKGETVFGQKLLDPADPVFSGHFPGFPVYPGVLQIEMGGQLGLCLAHFFRTGGTAITADAAPQPVRATRVLGAYFLAPVEPGQTVEIIGRKLEYDGYFGTIISQVIADDKICCVSAAEVVFLDED